MWSLARVGGGWGPGEAQEGPWEVDSWCVFFDLFEGRMCFCVLPARAPAVAISWLLLVWMIEWCTLCAVSNTMSATRLLSGIALQPRWCSESVRNDVDMRFVAVLAYCCSTFLCVGKPVEAVVPSMIWSCNDWEQTTLVVFCNLWRRPYQYIEVSTILFAPTVWRTSSVKRLCSLMI